VETPPVVTPPVQTPPVQTPPVETPPVQTPPESTPPVETPPVETPVEKPDHPTSPNTPNAPEKNGGGVLSQEQGTGGGGVVTASPAETALPFTGSEVPLLMLLGVTFLGVGLVLRRVSSPG
jgi:hypothetical protein